MAFATAPAIASTNPIVNSQPPSPRNRPPASNEATEPPTPKKATTTPKIIRTMPSGSISRPPLFLAPVERRVKRATRQVAARRGRPSSELPGREVRELTGAGLQPGWIAGAAQAPAANPQVVGRPAARSQMSGLQSMGRAGLAMVPALWCERRQLYATTLHFLPVSRFRSRRRLRRRSANTHGQGVSHRHHLIG